MAVKFKVRNQDVDGSSSKVYAKRANAVKYFEDMVGYKFENVIAEVYYHIEDPAKLPKADTLKRLSAVGMFGNRVTFEEIETL